MMERFIRGFIYSNLFVASVLSSLVLASYVMIPSLGFRFYVPLSVFLGSYVLYTFHRLYKIDFIPQDQLAARHRWVLERANAMKVTMSLAVFGLMLLLPNFKSDTVVWLVPAGIVSVGYTIPILPSQHGWRRFRDIPLTKPIIIALVVTYLTLAFPMFEQEGIGSILEPGFLTGFAERMLFIIVVTLPFELRDIVNDRDAGILTIGTQYGFRRAKTIGYGIIGGWFLSMMVQVIHSGWSFQVILPSTVLLLAVVAAYSALNERWSDLRYTLVFEGLILVYAALWAGVQYVA